MKYYQSQKFGMHFWLDYNNDFCYCPTFDNNEPDKDNWNYVCEWTEFDSTDLNELFEIHRELVVRRAHKLDEVKL